MHDYDDGLPMMAEAAVELEVVVLRAALAVQASVVDAVEPGG